jgi:hypothetical protein
MTLHQCGEMAVLGPGDQIAFPMSGNGAILDLRGPVSYGHSVRDLPTRRFLAQACARSPHGVASTKMRHQFLLQHPTSLYEEAPIDCLVRHLHVLSVQVS